MTRLNTRIAHFYDASSGIWEEVWGEHMHHGHYGPGGQTRKERKQAQVDLIEELLTFAGVERAQAVIDMGCGIGGSSLYLADRFGARVTGLTLSHVQARRATEREESRAAGTAPDRNGRKGQARFLVLDALDCGLSDASFDLVWSCESAEHMGDKERLLSECARLLRPGGILAMAAWCVRETRAPARPLSVAECVLIDQIRGVYCLPPLAPLSVYQAAARDAGLKNIATTDWTAEVTPFWDDVIDSALSVRSVVGLVRSGWTTVRAAFAAALMRQAVRSRTIRFGVMKAVR